jgi:hypothetical protein
MKTAFKRFVATLGVLALMGSIAIAATMDYLGTWNNKTNYAVGKVVVYNKAIYYSKQGTKTAPNVNRIPSSNPTFWEQVGTVGNTILSGIGNPTSPNLGQIGDYYIDTQTNTIYGPKVASGNPWPATGVSLVGTKGDPGAAGPAGPQGAAGAAGPQGPTGPTGVAGTNGSAGTAGTDGKTILSGTTIPDPSSGADGDFYLNTATSLLYGPKTINGWPSNGTSLVGPQGEQGAQGIQGLSGPQGTQGAQGPVGPQGPAGTDGAVGPAGSQGLQGAQGAQGVAGPNIYASQSCSAGGYITGFSSSGQIICSNTPQPYSCYQLTSATYNYNADVLSGVKSEFGANATIAEWNTIKAQYGSTPASIQNFMAATQLPLPKTPYDGSFGNIYVTSDSNEFIGGLRYLMTRFDGTVDGSYAVLDSIQNDALVLGRWTWPSRALAYVCN